MDRIAEREELDRELTDLRDEVETGPTQQPWWGSLVIVGITLAFLFFMIWAFEYQLTFTSRDGSVYQFPWW